MIIFNSLIKVRIPAVILLLVSVSFLVYPAQIYSQANNLLTGNTRDKIFRLTHPLNYNPETKTTETYNNIMFRTLLPETLNVYALRVQFKTDDNPQTTGNGRFDVSTNYPDSVDAPPHDSLYFIYKLEFLKNYYYKASKGKLIIKYTLFPGVRNLSNEMESYSPRRTENLSRMGNLFFDVWRSADSTIDFSGINPNNSAFIIFHAGVGRDVDLESQGLFVGQLDLPSIYMSQSSLKSVFGDTTQGYYTNEGLIIKNSCMLPEQEYRIVNTSFGDVYLELGMNGIVVATIGSHLGLPDLFNTNDGTTAIGRFGLMDGQAIFSYLGVFPPEPSAWEKQYLGWVEPNSLFTSGSFTTKAASIDVNGNESVYKILISGKEYFLVENRNRDANNNGQTIYYVSQGVNQSVNFTKDEDGFNSSDIWKLKGSITDVDELDWSLPGLKNDTANYQGGIIVWHIDENVIDAKIASNTINNDINHRGVDVEEAKGSQDIGVVVSTPLGDIISDGFFVDFWYNGNHYRPSNIYRNEFNNTSFPNSKSYSNVNSRVCLSQFSQIGSSMTFNYEVCGDVANINSFPRFVGKDISGNSQAMGFDFNNNGFDEIFVNVNDSLFGFRDNGNSIRVDMPNGYLKDSASTYAAGFLNYSLSGNSKTIIGVTGNKLNLITFNIDSNTTAPLVQSIDAGVRLTTPDLFIGDINQQSVNNIIFSGTQSGKIAKFRTDSLLVTFDSVSNLPIISLARKLNGNLPVSYAYINNSYKFFASSNILFYQPADSVTSPVKITNDNRILRQSLSGGDTVISGNLGILSVNSTPTICDLNGDGEQEIILTADNKIYAINKFGVVLDNFPLSIPNVSSITGGVAVADLNNDGTAEVIFGTGEGRLYAYSINGKILDGFPLLTGGRISSTPAVINSNGNFGLLIYSEDGYLYGFRTEWAYNGNKILWKNFLRNAEHSNNGAGSITTVSSNQPCLPSDKVYNWPNPAYGKTTNIRYYLNGDVTSVNIKIMDLAGELVTKLTGTTHKGFDNEVPWDISTVQSGIYIAIIELSGGCGETASIKIAVVK